MVAEQVGAMFGLVIQPKRGLANLATGSGTNLIKNRVVKMAEGQLGGSQNSGATVPQTHLSSISGGASQTTNSWLLATTVIESLIGSQVKHFVLSPGSRNAGLAIALAEAEKQGLIKLHVRIDERVAGFTALGIAKATGHPVAVVATSGTAIANLHPAVMEAYHSNIALIVVSADRPVALRDTGASQTGNQLGIFDPQLVAQTQLVDSPKNPSLWQANVHRALAGALGIRTNRVGPAQLNLHIENPTTDLPVANWKPTPRPLNVAGSWLMDSTELKLGPKTVVLVGDASRRVGVDAHLLAEQAGFPLFAEPSSNARFQSAYCRPINNYRLLLDTLGEKIERVIMYGHPTLSRPVSRLISRKDVELIVVTDGANWADPAGNAAKVVSAVDICQPATPDFSWLQLWRTADDKLTEQICQSSQGFSSFNVVRKVVSSVDSDQNLVFASSNSIREADLVPATSRNPAVYSNRGLAGIDGNNATASGIAIATGRPTTLITGDLAFSHDISALARTELEKYPDLRIVVIDDHGGSIFCTLEQGQVKYSEYFERVFATSQATNLAGVAESFGAATTTVSSMAELDAALAEPITGLQVVVAKVSRSDRRQTQQKLAWLGKTVTDSTEMSTK